MGKHNQRNPHHGLPLPGCLQEFQRPSDRLASFSADTEQSHLRSHTSARVSRQLQDRRLHSRRGQVLRYALHVRHEYPDRLRPD